MRDSVLSVVPADLPRGRRQSLQLLYSRPAPLKPYEADEEANGSFYVESVDPHVARTAF